MLLLYCAALSIILWPEARGVPAHLLPLFSTTVLRRCMSSTVKLYAYAYLYQTIYIYIILIQNGRKIWRLSVLYALCFFTLRYMSFTSS